MNITQTAFAVCLESFPWWHRHHFALAKTLNFHLHPFYSVCSLVGSSGLEPPTSRLSGARSNHLSYEPMLVSVYLVFSNLCLNRLTVIPPSCSALWFPSCVSSISAADTVRWWRWWESNPWPPACRAGALPAELHPHIRGYSFEWNSHSKLNNKRFILTLRAHSSRRLFGFCSTLNTTDPMLCIHLSRSP